MKSVGIVLQLPSPPVFVHDPLIPDPTAQGMPAMGATFAVDVMDNALRRGLTHVVGMRVHQWSALPDLPGCVPARLY